MGGWAAWQALALLLGASLAPSPLAWRSSTRCSNGGGGARRGLVVEWVGYPAYPGRVAVLSPSPPQSLPSSSSFFFFFFLVSFLLSSFLSSIMGLLSDRRLHSPAVLNNSPPFCVRHCASEAHSLSLFSLALISPRPLATRPQIIASGTRPPQKTYHGGRGYPSPSSGGPKGRALTPVAVAGKRRGGGGHPIAGVPDELLCWRRPAQRVPVGGRRCPRHRGGASTPLPPPGPAPRAVTRRCGGWWLTLPRCPARPSWHG